MILEIRQAICLSNEREAPYMIVYVGICMDMSAHVGM